MSEQDLLDDSWIDAEAGYSDADREPQDPNSDRRTGLIIVGAMVAVVLFLQFTVTDKAILGAGLVLLILVPMVLFHEWGHFWTARKSGIACKEFFVGFGPRIWSVTRGETEYGIKAGFPAGGYVRIVGMSQYEEVEPKFKGRTFRDAKPWKRAVVLVAGSTTHFISALVLTFILLVFFGNPLSPPTTALDFVADSSPASAAGVEVGDEILAIDGVEVEGDWEVVQQELQSRPGEEITITYVRDGETQTTTATLEAVESNGEEIGRLGIGPSPRTYGPAEAVPATFQFFGDIWWTSMAGLGDVFAPSNLGCIANQIGGGDCETTDRFISPVGVGQVAVVSAEAGLAAFMFLLIAINIFVGTLNLLPLLPFDGGHLAVLGYEQTASKIKGRKVEVDQAKLIPITVTVLGLLGVIFLSSLYLDSTAGLPIP